MPRGHCKLKPNPVCALLSVVLLLGACASQMRLTSADKAQLQGQSLSVQWDEQPPLLGVKPLLSQGTGGFLGFGSTDADYQHSTQAQSIQQQNYPLSNPAQVLAEQVAFALQQQYAMQRTESAEDAEWVLKVTTVSWRLVQNLLPLDSYYLRYHAKLTLASQQGVGVLHKDCLLDADERDEQVARLDNLFANQAELFNQYSQAAAQRCAQQLIEQAQIQ